MTTQNKLNRSMRAVAKTLMKFDLLESGSKIDFTSYSFICKGASQKIGVYSYLNDRGITINSYPDKQGNPHSDTINEMLRNSYLTRDKGRLYLTPHGKQELINR